MAETKGVTRVPEENTPSPSGQDVYDAAVRKVRTLPCKQNAPLDPKLIEKYVPEATEEVIKKSNTRGS